MNAHSNSHGRIRVLYVIQGIMPTGPGKHLYKLLAHRNRATVDARVFAFDQCDPSMMASLEKDFDVKWQSVGRRFTHPATYLRGVPQLLKAIDDFDPHIIQTHHTVIVDWAARLAAKLRRVPLNLSRAVSKPKDYHATRGGKLAWWFHYFGDRLTDGVVDYYLPNSLDVGDYLNRVDRVSESRLIVIPNGVDAEYFKPTGELRRQGRQSLGVSDDELLIVNVGPLKALKRQDLLVDATLKLLPRFPHLKVTFVGRTWGAEDETYLRKMRQTIESADYANNFTFTGELEDVRPILAAADLYVHPSVVEGSSNAVLEAMAMGQPCVVSDLPSCCELVVHGENGLVSARNDLNSLIDSLELLLSNEERRKVMGAASRQRALDGFSVSRMCASVEEVYRRGLSEKGITLAEAD
jgi:glycosyltransferase involved in cell wall biosynthesis